MDERAKDIKQGLPVDPMRIAGKCFKDRSKPCMDTVLCEQNGCVRKDGGPSYQRAPGHVNWNPEGTTPPPDPVTEAIRQELLLRQRVGWTKYGIGLGRPDFTMKDWLHHLYEELLDATQYVKRLLMTLDGSLPVTGSRDNVEIEQELPAQEIARLTREIGERQARIMRLVGGDPTKGVHVPIAPVVYSHPTCIFNYCPNRAECEPGKSCVHPIQSQNQEPAAEASAPER